MVTNEAGPVSAYVAANVRRLRSAREWSLARLAQEMEAVGRPILTTGLHRLENGSRRVDADDLVGLAAAFRVSPITLLLPPTVDGTVELTTKIEASAREAWDWLRARIPLSAVTAEDDEVFAKVEFQRRSLPAELRRYPATGPGLDAMQEDNPNLRVVRVADLQRELGGDADEHQETP